MIQSKDDLYEYLKCDKIQLGIERKYPRPFTDEIWKYQICLRRYEYWMNCRKDFIGRVVSKFCKLRLHHWSVKLGIFIGPNTCGKGLCITHPCCIQINWHAVIGENLRIQEGVTIGGDLGGGTTYRK